MNLVSTTLLIAVVIFLSYRLIESFLHYKRYLISRIKLRTIRGPPARNLLVGNIGLFFNTTPAEVLQHLRKWAVEYYPFYQVGIILGYSVNIVSCEDFETVLSNTKHIDKSIIYTMLNGWLKTGLLTSNGAKWHNRRKILTPAFHFNILQQFIPVFNEETDQLVENLKKECRNAHIDVNSHLVQFSLSTMSETSLGVKMRFETAIQNEYKNNIFKMGELLVYRLLHPWFLLDWLYHFHVNFYKEMILARKLRKFTGDIIKERKKTFKPIEMNSNDTSYLPKNERRLAMLDLLFNAQMTEDSIDDEGIQEEVDTFMFEGHDTTAVALSYALMLLACNRECQNKARWEILEVLGDANRKPTYNDLKEFQYLNRCVKESLRLYPSVHFISRETGEDLVLSDGFLLPKDTVVNLHIFDLHRDPKHFPEPEKFDPDRFLPENCKHRHPFAYLPFSAGPRNCIGQRFAMLEMKAVLCGILTNFFLEPVDTPDTVVTIADLVLRSKENIKVKFVRRE